MSRLFFWQWCHCPSIGCNPYKQGSRRQPCCHGLLDAGGRHQGLPWSPPCRGVSATQSGTVEISWFLWFSSWCHLNSGVGAVSSTWWPVVYKLCCVWHTLNFSSVSEIVWCRDTCAVFLGKGSKGSLPSKSFLFLARPLKLFLLYAPGFSLPVLGLSTHFSFLLWCGTSVWSSAFHTSHFRVSLLTGLEMVQINCFAQAIRGAVTSQIWSFLSHPPFSNPIIQLRIICYKDEQCDLW